MFIHGSAAGGTSVAADNARRCRTTDLQPDVPLAQGDVLGLERQPGLLLGEQHDLLARSSRAQLPVRHVLPHVTDRHAGGCQARHPPRVGESGASVLTNTSNTPVEALERS